MENDFRLNDHLNEWSRGQEKMQKTGEDNWQKIENYLENRGVCPIHKAWRDNQNAMFSFSELSCEAVETIICLQDHFYVDGYSIRLGHDFGVPLLILEVSVSDDHFTEHCNNV